MERVCRLVACGWHGRQERRCSHRRRRFPDTARGRGDWTGHHTSCDSTACALGGSQMRTRTQPPTDTQVTARRRRRWPIVALVVVVVLAAVFYLGGGWYFSGRLYQQALSGAAKRAAGPTYNLSVVAVAPATVTLGVPPDPGQLLTPGCGDCSGRPATDRSAGSWPVARER